MADSVTKIVHAKEQVNACINWLDTMICKGLDGGPVAITLGRPEENRNSPTNARFHAMIADLQKQAVITMPGRRITLADYDMDACKALLVMWFARERELNGEPLTKPPRSIIDPVSGEKISIRPSTAKWGKRDASDFIEFLFQIGADCKVAWGDPALKEFEQYREAQ
jgi:hypothetical protein